MSSQCVRCSVADSPSGSRTCLCRVVLNKDYLRETYAYSAASAAGDAIYKHMSLISSGMGDVSEEVIDTVARHDADATSSYTAHAAEELDISALLAEDEKVVAQLPISAFFGFPSKDEGEDVKGDCVLVLTQSSGDGHKRLLFVYTGVVQRTLKGSERYGNLRPSVISRPFLDCVCRDWIACYLTWIACAC